VLVAACDVVVLPVVTLAPDDVVAPRPDVVTPVPASVPVVPPPPPPPPHAASAEAIAAEPV
jgi:hypothetical protein